MRRLHRRARHPEHQVQGLVRPVSDRRGRMKRFRLGRQNPRASRIAFGVAAAGAALALAACSSSSSSSGSTPQSTSSGGSGSSSNANLSALNDAVNKASAVPSFSDYGANYGGNVPTTGLAGKKIMIIPGVSALAACTEIAQATAALATAVGMKPTIFANQGTPAEHNTAIENAIHQHYAAIAIVSKATPATATMENALRSELMATCPKCTVTDVNVEVPDWTNQIANATSSALLQHPNATVIFPFYAGMLTYMLAGIQSAHRSGNVKTYLAFGGGTPFIKLQTADPGKSIIQSDIGGYPPWTGYLMFLQAARALQKMAPIPYDKAIGPNRMATPDNAVNVLTTGGWGTDWVNGFRALLGLPALSGAALTAAATLDGAMVGQV